MIVCAIRQQGITEFLKHIEAEYFDTLASVLLLYLVSHRGQLQHHKVVQVPRLLEPLVILPLAFLQVLEYGFRPGDEWDQGRAAYP